MTVTTEIRTEAFNAHQGLSKLNIQRQATALVSTPAKSSVATYGIPQLTTTLCWVQAVVFLGVAFPALWAVNTGSTVPLIVAAVSSLTLAAYVIIKSMGARIFQKRGESND